MRMNYRFGYGSENDGDIFDLTVCDSCADTVANAIESVCAINPHLTVDDAFFPCDEPCSGDALTAPVIVPPPRTMNPMISRMTRPMKTMTMTILTLILAAELTPPFYFFLFYLQVFSKYAY